VVTGLEAFQPVAGRSALKPIRLQGRPVMLVDDSYNANPDSVAAAIAVLGEMPGPRWLVLGDMGEVGAHGPLFHREAGEATHRAGIEHLWCVGALSAETARLGGGQARHFDTVEALLAALPQMPPAASVLVKGSRFMQMERVVRALEGAGDAA
jgi:UDP-N-acetylmuramoyl-tripeptide--D-alanyl-D-alanine ligase